MSYLSDFNMSMYILQEVTLFEIPLPPCLPREPFLHTNLGQLMEPFRKFQLASLP